jgi:hypothetical protein
MPGQAIRTKKDAVIFHQTTLRRDTQKLPASEGAGRFVEKTGLQQTLRLLMTRVPLATQGSSS